MSRNFPEICYSLNPVKPSRLVHLLRLQQHISSKLSLLNHQERRPVAPPKLPSSRRTVNGECGGNASGPPISTRKCVSLGRMGALWRRDVHQHTFQTTQHAPLPCLMQQHLRWWCFECPPAFLLATCIDSPLSSLSDLNCHAPTAALVSDQLRAQISLDKGLWSGKAPF